MNTEQPMAFPSEAGITSFYRAGMTLRDYFAAKVLAGTATITNVDFGSLQEVAEMCYRLADAMMEARK